MNRLLSLGGGQENSAIPSLGMWRLLTGIVGALLLLGQASLAHAQQVDWVNHSWGLGSAEGYSVAVDESGVSVVTGTFQETVIFGRDEPNATTLTSVGNGDIFIARYDANGDLLWVKAVGAAGYDRGNAVAFDAQGDSYVVGHFVGVATFGEGPAARTLTSSGSGDLFLAKLDSAGNFLWVQQAGGNIGAISAIAVDADGGSYITGSFAGTTTFAPDTPQAILLSSSGDTDLFVARFDANGELLWVNQAGGSAADSGRGIAIDADGHSYVTGTFAGTATFAPATPQAITLTSNGGTDLFVARYAANGDLLWARKAGASDNDYGQAIAVDEAGNSTVAGAQGSQLYVARYTVDGNRLWIGVTGGVASNAWGNAVAVDAAGNSYVVGEFTGGTSFSFLRGNTNFVQFGLKNSGASDGFLATYNADGTQMWARAMGGSLYDTAYGIAVDGAGNSVVTGAFMSAATLYPLRVSGPGTQLFIAHFAPTTQPITVNTPADPGDGVCTSAECTLREALTLANDYLLGENTIAFNIPGPGPHTIQPSGNLPTIIDPVIIDGYTQPGAQPNTNPMTEPINATILVEIDGSHANIGFDFTGNSWNSVVRGLAMNRFRSIALDDARRIRVEGNFIGTDPSGTQALGNGIGFASSGGIGGTTPMIGGTTPAARNLIAGNGTGIAIGALSFATVEGNFIGTDHTGTQALGNGVGVIASNCVGCELGRITLRNNLIAGNTTGVRNTYTCCSITGNLVGTDRSGQSPLPNSGDGLVVSSYDLSVGGNLIAFNGGSGIRVGDSGGANLVRIVGNRIFANGAAGITVTGSRTIARISENLINGNGTLGIDLNGDGVTLNDPGDGDQGANSVQNFPVVGLVTSASQTWVQGVLNSTPSTAFTLAFYANTSCDPSHFGEGEQFLGTVNVTTDSRGEALFNDYLPTAAARGTFITATATGNRGTSEFSSCRVVGATLANQLLVVNQLSSSYDPTPVANAPAGVMRLTATFANQSAAPLTSTYFRVATLTGGNLLLNGDAGPSGVGGVIGGPVTVAPNERFAVTYAIGLQQRQAFEFYVDAYGLDPDGLVAAEPEVRVNTEFDLSFDDAVFGAPSPTTLENPVYLPLINR